MPFVWGDDSPQFGRRVLLLFAGVVAAASVLLAVSYGSVQSYFFIPSCVGGCAMLLCLLTNSTLSSVVTELMLYCCCVTVLLNDWHGAKFLGNRTWPLVIVFLDVGILCQLAFRVPCILAGVSCLWLLLVGTDEAYRWGLTGSSFDSTFSENTYNCTTPPCSQGATALAAAVLNAVLLLTNLFFMLYLMHCLHVANERLSAAISAVDLLASSVCDKLDLELAEEALYFTYLPKKLSEPLESIINSLESYRPYIPEALFAESFVSGMGRDDAAPGIGSGKAAIVFTDILGSTATWELAPDAMRSALRVHDKTLRECIAATQGYEVKTIGDSFMVAFETADGAVQFGFDVQCALVDSAWPAGLLYLERCAWESDGPWCGLRVRIGVHCGEVDVHVNPLTGRYDYFGNTVNKAARMEGVCVAGAVAVTQEVLEEMTSEGMPCCKIDMGKVEVKGLQGSVLSYLLLPCALAGRREFIEGQLLLKREQRQLLTSLKIKSPLNSHESSASGSSGARKRKSSGWSTGTDNYRCLHVQPATVGVVEVSFGDEDVEDMSMMMNSVLAKVSTSSERTHGTVVSLQGSRVAVSWNGVGTCATHVENSLVFIRLVGAGWGEDLIDLHLGVATGDVKCGIVGGKRQKFVAVLGMGMDVAAKLCTDAVKARALCYYASASVPSSVYGYGLTTIQKGVFTADEVVMHLFELFSTISF